MDFMAAQNTITGIVLVCVSGMILIRAMTYRSDEKDSDSESGPDSRAAATSELESESQIEESK